MSHEIFYTEIMDSPSDMLIHSEILRNELINSEIVQIVLMSTGSGIFIGFTVFFISLGIVSVLNIMKDISK